MDVEPSIRTEDQLFSSAGWAWNGINQSQNLGSIDGGYAVDDRAPKFKNGSSSSAAANRASVSVACVSCRSRHLKCDAARHAQDAKQMALIVTTSNPDEVGKVHVERRSIKPMQKIPPHQIVSRQSSTPAATDSSPTDFGQLLQSPPASAPTIATSSITSDVSLARLNLDPSPSHDDQALTYPASHTHITISVKEKYVKAYFGYFAPSHPFLPPKEITLQIIEQRGLKHLDLAIQYVACRYFASTESNELKDELMHILFSDSTHRDGFYVQALLLFAIGLHSNDEPVVALEAIDVAVNVALELGMNNAKFAVNTSGGNKVLEEAWRRTWWELFVLNAFFAGINRKSEFTLRTVTTDMLLPCEEREFHAGRIPPSETVEAYDNEFFLQDDKVFSSFAYLIHAAKILGSVLRIDPNDNKEEKASVDQADTDLVNWQRFLPDNKKEVITRDGFVDEVLLQAHMIISSASIMLHRPRSALDVNPVGNIRTCVSSGEWVLPMQTREFHTVKAIQAADDLAKLIRLPSPISRRTPFFTCAIVMSSVVHLSYWSFIVPDGEDEPVKGAIKLDTGALKELAVFWPIAGTCLGQVKGVAHEMFASKKAISLHTWSSMSGDFQRMIEDTGTRAIEEEPMTDIAIAG